MLSTEALEVFLELWEPLTSISCFFSMADFQLLLSFLPHI